VDHLPAELPHEPEAQLVVIRAYPSVIEADLAKNALGAAGIESMIRAEGAVRRNYLGLELHDVELFVRADEAEDADKILDGDVPAGNDQRCRTVCLKRKRVVLRLDTSFG
jgi:hypothetical protein